VSEWMKYVWGHLAYSRDKVFQINLSRDAHFSRALCPRILCAGVNPFDRAFIKTRRETDATITCFPCVIESRLRFRENGGEWNLLCDYELRYASGSKARKARRRVDGESDPEREEKKEITVHFHKFPAA